MPRGKWSGHKGKSRKFTNPDELEAERKKDEQERAWRKARGDPSSEEEEEEASAVKPQAVKTSDDSSSESEESEDEDAKGKGVEKLIEISNPNRVQQKAKKLATLNETLGDGKTELTRKEREELEKQQAAARYRKLHAEGKTHEAQADLARLAIIKKQREDAAKKREAERLQKEAELKEKSAARDKALGKKS